MPNYWIVGAQKYGSFDYYSDFIQNGYWKLFYSDDDQPAQAKRRDQIKPDDRIAIKKMVGGPTGAKLIIVRAIGIVQALDPVTKRVSVDWLLVNMDREVSGRGCIKAVSGPFTLPKNDQLIKDVFHI